MSGITLDDAKQAKEEAQSDNLRENDAGIPDELRPDYDESDVLGDVKLHPEVLVTYDHIARISIQDYGSDDNILDLEQNLQGGGLYGYDVEITVASPEIVEGQLWEEDTDGEYPSYKILGDPEDEGNPYELNENPVFEDDDNEEFSHMETEGVSQLPGGNSWDGQPIELDVDYVTLTINGSRGVGVLGALDTAGMWHTTRDGDVVEGLFEALPRMGTDDYDASEDGYPRLTGFPELRSDVVGKQGAIACTFDPNDYDESEGPSTRTRIDVTFYEVTDDGLRQLTPLTPDDDAYALPTYPRVNNTFWDGNASGVGADAEPESNGGVEEAQAIVSGGGDDETTYEDLTDDGQEFVDTALSAMEDADMDSTDEFAEFGDPFEARVEQERAASEMDADAETLDAIIERHVE